AAYDRALGSGSPAVRSICDQGVMLAVVDGSAFAVVTARRGAGAPAFAATACGASAGSTLGRPCQKPRSLMMSFAVMLARPTRLAAWAGRFDGFSSLARMTGFEAVEARPNPSAGLVSVTLLSA